MFLQLTKTFLLLFLIFINSFCCSQNHILWGYALNGGQHGDGIILNYNVATATETDVHDFSGATIDGQNPLISFVKANNGLLYGVTLGGGEYNRGTIFSYNISTGVETDLHDFGNGTDGQLPHGFLIQANNNLLYGMTQAGGTHGNGILYSYNISNGVETDLHDFASGADGNTPYGSLVQASNGLLYGVVGGGGMYGGGTIYSYDIFNNSYAVLHEFGSGTDGYNPQGSLTQVGDSLLYGMTIAGGAYGTKIGGAGVIFSYNINTGIETVVHDFGSGTDGKQPYYGKLLQVNDSLLYGLTRNGGSNDTATAGGDGTIFSYIIKTGAETVLYSFGSGTDGKQPLASLIQASNGLLYGMTSTGGLYGSIPGDGIIFSFDLTTNIETDVHDFNGTDGKNPWGSLIEVDTATIYAAPTTICAGSSTLLTAQGSPTYTWSPATGLSATTGDSVIANPSVTTTYTVTGTGAIPTYPTTVTVTVNPVPVITVNTPLPVCSGTSAILAVNGAANYIWSPVAGLSSATDSTVTATPTATTTYTVIGISHGCADTSTTIITVKAKPILNAPAPPTICNGNTDTLTVSGANTYTWSPIAGLNATTGSSISAAPATTTTYTVIGIAINGCADTNTVTVNVSPKLILDVNIPPAKCMGSADTLTVTGGNTYMWYPATGLNATIGSTVIITPTITTTYTITGTSFSGCSGIDSVPVVVNPNPTLNVPGSTVCLGDSATLTCTGAQSYVWQPSTGLNVTTGSSVLANPTTDVTYTVTGMDSIGCTATGTSVVTVVLPPNKPVITESQSGDTLFSSAQNGNQWYRNGTVIKGATDSFLVITGLPADTYKVEVTDVANGCSSVSDSVITTGINQLSVNSNQLSIYPNPSNGSFAIISTKNIDNIKVTNLLGQLIYEAEPKRPQFTFELRDAGMYFVTVTISGRVSTSKVIVNQ